MLVKHFRTATGRWMHRVAHGVDERDVVIESVPKSVSRESTFERDLHVRHDRAALSEIFTGLCVRVADDLERKGVCLSDHRDQVALCRFPVGYA